ncbi:helix-turn-helix domain-containing protein [Streptomyces sp. NPDC050560]|uniref:helix-turn-helix domain-containing protein n=1 Tax=Streptomyces sp. NPDC050560 TaxID=3365630 RepID=UPI0037B48A43
MADETRWDNAPSALRMILGRRLEELRRRAGLTFEQAGEAIGVSHSTIRRLEAAKVGRLRLADVEKLLQTYGVDDREEVDTFLRSAREANKRGWWHGYRDVMPDWFEAYLNLEQAALHIRAYEQQFIHGLLQTREYARALLTAGNPHAPSDDIERMVELRLRRQELLRRQSPPLLWVVMDETVLRWPVGGPKVMRAQLDHLMEVSSGPRVRLQVMPFAGGPHPGMRAGSFHLFRFEARELPEIVYLGGLVGSVYLDQQSDVVVYRETLDRIGAQSVPATRTRNVLGAIRKEL